MEEKEEEKEEKVEEKEEKVDEDLLALLDAAEALLMSLNSAVVLAAAALLLHLAPEDSNYVLASVAALIHCLQRDARCAFFVLNTIEEVSALSPKYFEDSIAVGFSHHVSYTGLLPARGGARVHHPAEDAHPVPPAGRGQRGRGAEGAGAAVQPPFRARHHQPDRCRPWGMPLIFQ